MYQQSTAYSVPGLQQQPNYGQPLFQTSQSVPAPGYNPFANQQTQQSLTVNTATSPAGFGSNPFTRSPTRIQSPQLTQIPEQSQQNFYNPVPQQSQPQQQQQQQQPMFQQQQFQPQMQQQPQQPQQWQQQQPQPQTNNPFMGQTMFVSQQATQLPQRPDNASIMALYNYPQLATNPFQAQQQAQDRNPVQANPADQGLGAYNAAQMQQQQPQQQQQPAAPISPPPGTKNPFLSQVGNPVAEKPTAMQPALVDLMPSKYNASRDSILAHGLEWSNGRHSPDAFASLSARDMR